MIAKTDYTNHRVWITWHDPDLDWHSFIVLWHDDTHVLLRGTRQRVFGDFAIHDGVPFVVKWNEIKTIRKRR